MIVIVFEKVSVKRKLSRNKKNLSVQDSISCYEKKSVIITHLASETYVWHGCKWNFAGPQIYLRPAEIKTQHFGVSLKFLVCNRKYCI